MADKLRALGHAVVFLHYVVQPRRANRLSRKQRQELGESAGEAVKRPVLPSYVFVGLTPPEDFYGVSNTPGVAALLRKPGGPEQISQEEIDRLRSWGDEDGRVPLGETLAAPRPRLEVGSLVRITRGPFEGFERPVERDDGRMIRVLAELFGGWVPVDLAYEDVEVIAEAA